MQPKTSYLSVTDQFCGAGGSSVGATKAGAEVIMALNHWQLAIDTHNTNFPQTRHDCTDISACDPRRYPSTDVLITSPECTNHSLAKGVKRKGQGQLSLFSENKIDPAAERSRATMWDVPRFAEYHNYNVIIVENVVDARRWQLFDAWIHAMRLLGYDHEIVYFNSMFAHPTPQSRDRMYVVFWKRGNRKPNLKFKPVAWCATCEKNVESVQSWKDTRKQWGRYGRRNQYVYRCPECAGITDPYYFCAANAIDWAIPGERIGDRKKPLKARTMERIAYGLEKFGRRYMTVQTDYSHSESRRTRLLSEVLPTQAARQALAMITPNQGDKYTIKSILEALPTMTASGQPSMIVPLILSLNHSDTRIRPVDDPAATVMPGAMPSLVVPPFIWTANRTDSGRSVEEALTTVMAEGNHHFLVTPKFILTLHTAAQQRGLDEALSTIVADGNHHFLVEPFVASYYGQETVRPIDEALGTQSTLDHHSLIEPQPNLNIEDCFFRMLQPHEIGAAMAFSEDYEVKGNNRDKVRQYGNAVTPPVMQQLVERCAASLR